MNDPERRGARTRSRRALALTLAALLPAAAVAQPDRSVPTGNPLGTATILAPRAPEPDAAIAPDAAAELRRGRDEAVLRARLAAAYRARQAALLAESARPLTDRGVDPGRRPDMAEADEQDRPRGAGGVPTIFGGGIGTAFGGGVRPAWQGY